jgi:glycosyltransferase involved in cell wall biosynthesis
MAAPDSVGPGAGGVSVIVPTRNRPGLLHAALASVLRQTRPVDQIVVVDDASDSTTELPAIAALCPSIEICRRAQRGGVSAARNDGIARARGDYLFFLDDDDLIAPRFVEQGLSVLDANRDADGVFFRYRTIVSSEGQGDGDPFAGEPNPARRSVLLGVENPVPRATLERRAVTAFLRYLLPIHSGFLRRTAIGETRFLDSLCQGEDTHFWISLAAAGRHFVLDEHDYAVIRRHAGNTTRSRLRYISEIQPCYQRLLSQGLLSEADDAFLAHLKLLWFKTLTGGKGAGPHFKHVLASPRLFAAELRFWTVNLATRLLSRPRSTPTS